MSQRSSEITFLLPAASLWRREVVRFVRQRSRIVGALGTPLVFWLLIGSGLGQSFRVSGAVEGVRPMNYLEYSVPGTLVLIVLFTAIFSMISVIEDRREGFMQAVVAAPVRRSAIVFGKVSGSATLAVIQAVLFLLLVPLAGVSLTVVSAIAVTAVLIVVAVGLSALGFVIAWPMDSTQGFHAIMNLVLMPMWLLSGAFFPASGASKWLGWLMVVNPLTYGVAAVRRTLYLASPEPLDSVPSLGLSIGVTIVFSILLLVLAARTVATKR